ncbi:unnamed protein product, partial [Prorocentrum cordatum]
MVIQHRAAACSTCCISAAGAWAPAAKHSVLPACPRRTSARGLPAAVCSARALAGPLRVVSGTYDYYCQDLEPGGEIFAPEGLLPSAGPAGQFDGDYLGEQIIEKGGVDELSMPFKKWRRVYYMAKENADPHWAAADPRKRVQVINVRDRSKVSPAPKQDIDYADVPGFSNADLIQIEKQSASAVRKRNNRAALTSTPAPKKGGGRQGRLPFVGAAVNIIGGILSWSALGYWGGASRAIYVVGKRLKAWSAPHGICSAAREVASFSEYASENMEEFSEHFEDLDFELMCLIAAGAFPLWGLLKKGSELRRLAMRSAGLDSDSDSDGSGSDREFGRSVSEVGEDVQMPELLASLLQSQSELAEKISQLKQHGTPQSSGGLAGGPTSSTPRAERGAELESPRRGQDIDSSIDALLGRLQEHESIVKTDAGTRGTAMRGPEGLALQMRPGAASSGSPSSSPAQALIEVIEKETVDPRGALMEHRHKYKDIEGWNLAGAKARIAPQHLARIYRGGQGCVRDGQHDARASDENELATPGADEEVRLRLEKKAFFNKYLTKAQEGARDPVDTLPFLAPPLEWPSGVERPERATDALAVDYVDSAILALDGLHQGKVSLPPAGATPVDMMKAPPTAAEFLNFPDQMIERDEEVDWVKFDDTKAFMSPELKDKSNLLLLAARLWEAGMLATCEQTMETVSVVTVLKKQEAGRRASRLVWDLRRCNLRWRAPPWVPLGIPISIANIELTDDMIGCQIFTVAHGDLPDFCYTILKPSWLHPWFVLAGIPPTELKNFAESEGFAWADEVGTAKPYLALKVLPMGWSWYVFFVHSTLQDVIHHGAAGLEPGGQLVDGTPTPQFDAFRKLFWFFIGDFAVGEVHDSNAEHDELKARQTLLEWKEAIKGAGFKVHKGVVEHGVSAFLGFISELGRDQRRQLWAGVKAELASLVALLPLFSVDLKAKWNQWACMPDASDEGCGVIAAATAPSEARAEARWARRRGRCAKLEAAYSEVEESESIHEDNAQGNATRSLAERVARQRASWRPGFLPLFSGAGVLDSAIREKRLSCVESWDIEMGPPFDMSDLARVAILIRRIRAKCYWCVHLAPPCSSFSRARQPFATVDILRVGRDWKGELR